MQRDMTPTMPAIDDVTEKLWIAIQRVSPAITRYEIAAILRLAFEAPTGAEDDTISTANARYRATLRFPWDERPTAADDTMATYNGTKDAERYHAAALEGAKAHFVDGHDNS